MKAVTKNIDKELIAKLQAAVDAAAKEIAQTIENPKTESIDVNVWFFTAEGEEEKLGHVEVEMRAKEGYGISDEEEEIIWKNIPLEMEIEDYDGDCLWWHVKGFGNKAPEDNADLAGDRSETIAFASPLDWDGKND